MNDNTTPLHVPKWGDRTSELSALSVATEGKNDAQVDTENNDDDLLTLLLAEYEKATKRVYQLDSATACDRVGLDDGRQLWLKREDQSRVHSFKWRGAYNRMASLVESGWQGVVVAASAGNHAQGIALAAEKLRVDAIIFMPRFTPVLKQQAVECLGGAFVEVRLVGDTYDQAAEAAREYQRNHQAEFIHPFDDLRVIAGQATLAGEISSEVDPDLVLLGIGGGGMAAGVAAVIRQRFPTARIVGVEVAGQASMKESIVQQHRVSLPHVSRLCDGTAVATPGLLNLELCRQLLDDVWVVEEWQVCTAMEWLWNRQRIVVEPSAAIGVAAALATSPGSACYDRVLAALCQQCDLGKSSRPPVNLLTVLSGANVDFMTLPKISAGSRLSPRQRRYYCFEIPERAGTLVGLLDEFLDNMNIIDFQYGKMDENVGFPVVGVEGFPWELDKFEQELPSHVKFEDVSQSAATEFRLVPCSPNLMNWPLFAIVEFPDRPGALREFMRAIASRINLCYFNYSTSRQDVGQALMGFEFDSVEQKADFVDQLKQSAHPIRLLSTSELTQSMGILY